MGGPILQPFGDLNYLWGNIPAFDALNIDQNEGVAYGGNLNLCFAASGDLRNVASSINGLPSTYDGNCTIVLNDKNDNVVARNITMLLMAAQLPPKHAAELMLHVWYSGRLTQEMCAAIDKYAREPIADVVCKIKNKSNEVLLSKRWDFGAAEVSVRLYKPQWTLLLQVLEARYDVTKTEQERRKVVLAHSRLDYRDRELYTLSGSRRMCSSTFRDTGVLAPFGLHLDHFKCPNPLLFNEKTSAWLQKDSASPLEGWSMQSILAPSNLRRTAKDDVNGLLYFHVRMVLETFCRRLQDPLVKTHFALYSVDAAKLPRVIDSKIHVVGFDRIEVSNIVDEAYVGLHRTLAIFAPLIKKPSVNPHATLITLFLNACEIADREMGNHDNKSLQKKQMDAVMKYTHSNPLDLLNPNSAAMFKFIAGKELVRDYDGIFKWYMDVVNFPLAAENAGLRMRERNTVVEAWPIRLKKKPGEQGAEEEFDRLMTSSCSGAERYVEWFRKD
ncbi:MAG: hypothetical protein Q9201_003224 [Fulgogasparrea decipioides]